MKTYRMCVAALVLTLCACLWPQAAQAASCTGSDVTGAVFRDYNANGSRDALEAGVEGMVVTAYAASGSSTTCESGADGSYGLDPAGDYPVRLEFTLPDDGSLGFLRAGAAGSGSRTSVTFVSGPTANVDVGLNNPADYCGPASSPSLATACYAYGEQNDNPDGVNKELPVLFSFPYGAGSTDLSAEAAVRAPSPTQLALAKEVGSVWGLAWNPATQTLYAAAFLKRHAGFGPGGPGAIYQITSGGASLWFNFGALAGSDPHPQAGQTCLSPGNNPNNNNANCWFNDSNAFDQVGKAGFGDLEINERFDTLYTLNLANNTLLAIPLAAPAAFSATAVPVPASCPAADFRPFGLGVHDGQLFVGAVCTAESTQNRNNLRAYVLRFANGVFAAAPVLDFALTYDRGAANLQWQYWLNRTTFNPTDPIQSAGRWAQPWLTDIVFDQDAMILGLRDRNADQFGAGAGGPDPASPQLYTAFARGDLLRACAGEGGWQLESNGSCGGTTTAGANNGEGPGGGEYYFQDRQLSPSNPETSWGGQVQIAGRPELAGGIYNPIEGAAAVADGGIKWSDNAGGATVRGYLVFDGTNESARFDSANGLGDLEAMCPAAPLELGNRVWLDQDGDGLQDPAEAGIDGVTVELYREDTRVATAVSAAGGHYLFNESNVTQNGANGIVPGLCGDGGAAVYALRIPQALGASKQPALLGLALTDAGAASGENGLLRDSDGAVSGLDAVAAVACAALAGPGANDHTLDFGFRPAPPVAADQTLVTDEDTPLPITLSAADPDAQPLTYSLITSPAHGVLGGSLPTLIYTPTLNFNGVDGFTFIVNDGLVDSSAATITITVQPVNDAPVAANQAVTTAFGISLTLTPTASDVDGDALTFRLLEPPAHGALEGSEPPWRYTPQLGFAGRDQVAYVANDGQVDSARAVIAIAVRRLYYVPRMER